MTGCYDSQLVCDLGVLKEDYDNTKVVVRSMATWSIAI